MSFNLYVQQNQWVVVALLAGTGLVVLFWLVYRALWRPRAIEERAEEIRITGPIGFVRWLFSFMPMVLMLVVLLVTIYTITHLVWAAARLPNW